MYVYLCVYACMCRHGEYTAKLKRRVDPNTPAEEKGVDKQFEMEILIKCADTSNGEFSLFLSLALSLSLFLSLSLSFSLSLPPSLSRSLSLSPLALALALALALSRALSLHSYICASRLQRRYRRKRDTQRYIKRDTYDDEREIQTKERYVEIHKERYI